MAHKNKKSGFTMTFKYRIKPTRSQITELNRMSGLLKELYNREIDLLYRCKFHCDKADITNYETQSDVLDSFDCKENPLKSCKKMPVLEYWNYVDAYIKAGQTKKIDICQHCRWNINFYQKRNELTALRKECPEWSEVSRETLNLVIQKAVVAFERHIKIQKDIKKDIKSAWKISKDKPADLAAKNRKKKGITRYIWSPGKKENITDPTKGAPFQYRRKGFFTIPFRISGFKVDLNNFRVTLPMWVAHKNPHSVLDIKMRPYSKRGNTLIKRRGIPIGGEIIGVSIQKTNTDKWYVNVTARIPNIYSLNETGAAVGIDMGIDKPITDSTGTMIAPLPWLEKMNRVRDNIQSVIDLTIKRIRERDKSDKHTKHQNMLDYHRVNKTRKVLNKITERILNKRQNINNLHAYYYVSKYDRIYLENNDYTKMAAKKKTSELSEKYTRKGDKKKNRKLLGNTPGEKRQRIMSMAVKYGKTCLLVPGAYTSQECSYCGYRLQGKNKLTLEDKTFICPDCGMQLQRDINAARNILFRGEWMYGQIVNGSPEKEAFYAAIEHFNCNNKQAKKQIRELAKAA